MSVRILASVHTLAHYVRQHLPSLPASDNMSVSIQGNGPMPVIYAMQDFLNRLASNTTSVLITPKNLPYVVYAAVGLPIMAIATVIKNAVAVLGSGSTKNA